ncbi:T9SS type B sorting domain-containing protein, partial [Flavobacterium ajazii]|uniref:T9SS type B sorting domain-containing protein n=1 Tax=Flavobacterium ajazii TaxID=2692318 RepID=UPI0013D0A564
ATITATLSTASTTDTVVSLGFSGTASGADYAASNTSITIPAGQLTGTITIDPTDDALYEGNETVIIDITGVSGGNGATENGVQQVTVTITDDETTPTVTLSGTTSIAENAAGTATITATLSTASTTDTVVSLGFSGTASGADYAASNTSITIPAGQLSGTITIDPTDDALYEGNETVIIDITNVTGGNGATENGVQQATVTITDDETTPTVSISAPVAVEGTNAVFTVSLDVPSSVDTVINVVTTNGTAGSLDYTSVNTTVIIPAGSTSATVIIPILNDAIHEPNETFILTGTVTSGTTSNTTVSTTGTITDNNGVPTMSISNPTASEGSPAVFTVSLNVASSVDTVINVVTTNGTAGSLDYTLVNTTVTIPAGSTNVTVSVPTLIDAINEASETFTLTGTITAGSIANTTAIGTATINDTSIVLIANNDEASPDGINGSLEFINVLDNDFRNGLKIDPSDVNIQQKTTFTYFEFNSDGTVNILPNTPGGTYEVVYEICEKAGSNNCTTAVLKVFVEAPSIAIIKTATFNDEDNSGYANAGETITYNFKITNTGNVPLYGIKVTDNLPGIVLSGQPISLQVGESDEHTFTATYSISQSDINNGSVTNQASVTGQSLLGVVVEDKSDDKNNADDNPTVSNIEGCVIKVFNAVSPNNDNLNDELNIRGIECYPDNTIEIYNRWGVLVFSRDRYDNTNGNFKGISEGRTTIKQSEKLPVGTYFYILKYKDSNAKQHESAGYLYLSN